MTNQNKESYICILHGYLLDKSGSNLWTRNIVRALCRSGSNVVLFSQENHPDRYDFISEECAPLEDGTMTIVSSPKPSEFSGKCVLVRPYVGKVLPVYVEDEYEEFKAVKMVSLNTECLEKYIQSNLKALLAIAAMYNLRLILANHLVLMSVVAQRASQCIGVPYIIMPHGSGLVYACAPDVRFRSYCAGALKSAASVIVGGDEMRRRLGEMFGKMVTGLSQKFRHLNLGIDLSRCVYLENRYMRRDHIFNSIRSIDQVMPRGRRPAGIEARRWSYVQQCIRNKQSPLESLLKGIQSTPLYSSGVPDKDLVKRFEDTPWAESDIMIFAGRVIAAKGIHTIIASLPLLLKENESLRVLVVGHGPGREIAEDMLSCLQSGDGDLLLTIACNGEILESAEDARQRCDWDGWIKEHPAGLRSPVALYDVHEDVTAFPFDAVRLFFHRLQQADQWDEYLKCGQRLIKKEAVTFTGLLPHELLLQLYGSCDIMCCPSVVPESGPLVLLEGMASGLVGLATNFAGAKTTLDDIDSVLGNEVVGPMRLRADPRSTAWDIVSKVPHCLQAKQRFSRQIRECVIKRYRRYDWKLVARTLLLYMEEVTRNIPSPRAHLSVVGTST